MKPALMKRLRALARQGRAILFPMGDISSHLALLTRHTAQDLRFEMNVVQMLTTATHETCHESGLSTFTPALKVDEENR